MKPRFSISNLLLVTAIIGILLAWYLERRQLIATLSTVIKDDTVLFNEAAAQKQFRQVDDVRSSDDGRLDHLSTSIWRDINTLKDLSDLFHKRIADLQTISVK